MSNRRSPGTSITSMWPSVSYRQSFEGSSCRLPVTLCIGWSASGSSAVARNSTRSSSLRSGQ
ncbi:hypothetical protein ABZ545_06425 [Streptomyces abikoensis]|uniref:hypothetical protein n=1 Tax=Streptomyces abikoensis TaxID=97398 RepID=UPI0033C210EF